MPLLDIYSQDLPKISLTLSMWKKAKDFADRQAHYQKAQQVYLNTLAVLSVDQYLQRSGFQTDLANSNGYDLTCLLYTSPSPRDLSTSRMPSSA